MAQESTEEELDRDLCEVWKALIPDPALLVSSSFGFGSRFGVNMLSVRGLACLGLAGRVVPWKTALGSLYPVTNIPSDRHTHTTNGIVKLKWDCQYTGNFLGCGASPVPNIGPTSTPSTEA